MTVLRIPAVCTYRGIQRRARTERDVQTWFTVPCEIPDVRSSEIEGRILIRDGRSRMEKNLLVVDGMAMFPALGTENEPLEVAAFERLIDETRAQEDPQIVRFVLFTDVDVRSAPYEDDVVPGFKEIAWSTRDDAEKSALEAASAMAVVDGIVHTALQEPVHRFEVLHRKRQVVWERVAGWRKERPDWIVARADRFASDGGPFGDGISIEGDLDAVRWRFRDADANALQVARTVFSHDAIADVADFQGLLRKVGDLASDIHEGVPDAAETLLDTIDEIVGALPIPSGRKGTNINNSKVDTMLEFARTVRYAHRADAETRNHFPR